MAGIAGTVATMLCVIVSLLFIGCALIPGIEHAASEISEYSALLGIIPIMCILGMGYVLIRRL